VPDRDVREIIGRPDALDAPDAVEEQTAGSDAEEGAWP